MAITLDPVTHRLLEQAFAVQEIARAAHDRHQHDNSMQTLVTWVAAAKQSEACDRRLVQRLFSVGINPCTIKMPDGWLRIWVEQLITYDRNLGHVMRHPDAKTAREHWETSPHDHSVDLLSEYGHTCERRHQGTTWTRARDPNMPAIPASV